MAPRSLLRVLLPAALLGAACATESTGRPPEPPSSTRVQEELGYRDVIQAGEEYARENSIVLAQAGEAVQLRPNYWRVRFALPEKGSGKVLELEFDSLARQVTRAQEIDIVTGASSPVGVRPSESSPVGSGSESPP